MSDITNIIYQGSAKVEDFDISVGTCSGFCACWCDLQENMWRQCRTVAVREIPG